MTCAFETCARASILTIFRSELICLVYPRSGEWSRVGCHTEIDYDWSPYSNEPLLINCTCNHLSTFAVLVDEVDIEVSVLEFCNLGPVSIPPLRCTRNILVWLIGVFKPNFNWAVLMPEPDTSLALSLSCY